MHVLSKQVGLNKLLFCIKMSANRHVLYTVCVKKLTQFVYARTSSNLYQIC